MKKIILGVFALVLFSSFSYGQTVTLFDLKGAEIAIMLKTAEENEFGNYYLFQYDKNDFSEIVKSNNFKLLEANQEFVKIRNENTIITFTIDNEYQNENEKIYYGYGLSNRKGKFQLAAVQTVMQNENNNLSGSINCHSGGEGASECSVTPSNVNVGTATCSVKCNKGYYACCDDTVGECRCKVEKVVHSITPN